MQRVLVIGSGGAGKSTLAARLAAVTGLPLIRLDDLYWRPGWVPTDKEEWAGKVNELLRGERWIMDGNYGGTMSARLAAADTVIFLDLPRLLCTWRVLMRSMRYRGRVRPGGPPGCPERLTLDFLLWVWTYPSRRRRGILRRLSELPSDRTVHILRSDADIERFMADTAAGGAK